MITSFPARRQSGHRSVVTTPGPCEHGPDARVVQLESVNSRTQPAYCVYRDEEPGFLQQREHGATNARFPRTRRPVEQNHSPGLVHGHRVSTLPLIGRAARDLRTHIGEVSRCDGRRATRTTRGRRGRSQRCGSMRSMRADLKSLYIEPDTSTLPSDPAEFVFLARMSVGPPDGADGETFDITVCTPEWLSKQSRRRWRVPPPAPPGRHDGNVRQEDTPCLA